MDIIRTTGRLLLLFVAVAALTGCEPPGPPQAEATSHRLELLGTVRAPELDEISGIAALPGGHFVVHNDDGPAEVFVIDRNGALRATIAIGHEARAADNEDWEDLDVVPGPHGPLLAIGDIGDNLGVRRSVRIYFVPLPAAGPDGRWPERLPVAHALRLRYVDGPRDVESLAYDRAGNRLLLISKRDVPPRIYGVALESALARKEVLLDFLGELRTLRPPSPTDLLRDPVRGPWLSQPTSLAIDDDGRLAALLTYRSLYLFRREPDEDWLAAFARKPVELLGPPGTRDEAVAFDAPEAAPAVVVTTEGQPAPVYRLPIGGILDGAAPGAAQSASTP